MGLKNMHFLIELITNRLSAVNLLSLQANLQLELLDLELLRFAHVHLSLVGTLELWQLSHARLGRLEFAEQALLTSQRSLVLHANLGVVALELAILSLQCLLRGLLGSHGLLQVGLHLTQLFYELLLLTRQIGMRVELDHELLEFRTLLAQLLRLLSQLELEFFVLALQSIVN